MKEYTKPELNVILFATENVCSGDVVYGSEEVPVIPDD